MLQSACRQINLNGIKPKKSGAARRKNIHVEGNKPNEEILPDLHGRSGHTMTGSGEIRKNINET